jgi:small subunit ribosomal protein S16
VSVAIRLSRSGRVHLPYYHIGVYDSRTRRDGRPVEELGFYDPRSDKEPVRLNLDRARYWLSVGAKPSATVTTLLKNQGVALPVAKKEKKAEKPAKAKAAPAGKKPVAKPGKPKKTRTASSKTRGERAKKAAN